VCYFGRGFRIGRRDRTCIEKMGAASSKWDNQALFMVTNDGAVKIVWPYMVSLWKVASSKCYIYSCGQQY